MTVSQSSAIFSFHSHQLRTFTIDGSPWFIGRDIALMLGYSKPQKAIREHCKYAKLFKGPDLELLNILAPRGILIIPESDVWRLIIRSTLPKAQEIEAWIMGEVLPTIRKTGKYEAAPAQKELPEATQKVLPGAGPEWRFHELMQRLRTASDECYSVYEELCALVAGLYDDLRNMEPSEVSGLASMLYAIRAAKNSQAGLLHAYNVYCHTARKRRGMIPDAWDKDVAVSEIKAYRVMVERMLGWEVPEGMLSRL